MKSKKDKSNPPVRKKTLLQASLEKTKKAPGESTLRYETLVKAVPVGIVENDHSGVISYCNGVFADLVGYAAAELIGKHTWELVTPKLRNAVRDDIVKILEDQSQPTSYVTKLARKNGKAIDVQIDLDWKRNRHGDMTGLISTVTDIPRHKEADAGFFEWEEQFRTAIEHFHDSVVLVKKQKLVYVNQKFLDIFGYDKPEEVIGKSPAIVIHPDDRPVVRQYRIQRERGEISPEEYVHKGIKKDGTIIFIEASISETLYRGDPVAFIYQKDITDRKTTEEALRESENKFRDLAEKALVGIYVVQDGFFRYVNDACAKMHGYESADELMRAIISTIDQMYVEPGDRKRLIKLLKEQDVVKDFQTRMYKKDGSTIWVSMTSHTVKDATDKIECHEGFIEDITKRKEAEEQLLESEERYRTAIEHSNDGVALIRNRRYIYVNRKFLEIFGYEEPEDVIGKHPMITAHPDDLKRLKEYGRKRQQGGRAPERYEYKGLRKDGTIIFIEVSIAETMYQGRPVVLCYLRDITERRLTDVVLKRSEERFRSLVEKSSEVIFLTDENQKRIYVSPPITRILGYTIEEFLSLKMGEFTHPDDAIAVNTARSHILANPGETVTFVNRLRHKDGSWRWVETTMRNLLNEPSIHSLVANFHDITESKLAEEALQESEAKYRSVVDNLLVGFYITQDNRFCFVNRALCEASGYSYDELVDKMNPLDLIHNDDKEFIAGIMVKRLAGEKDYEGHMFKVLRKDGQVMIVKGVSNLIIYNGRPAIAGGIMDITRETTLESQLRQAQKMEAVGTLAGGIAHDFNNILTAIIGYGRLLQMKMAETDPLRTYVAHMLSSSETAANLTRNLLAFSRKQIVELKPVNVGSIVKGTEGLLKSLLTEDIELKILLPDSDITITADTSQVEQVLLNLASNANDAMPRGGMLTIETKKVELKNICIDGYDYVEPGQYVLISVADTGIGIDEKTRDKIFEPFFTTKEVGKGTGLGLSIVHGIVEQHHGYITVNKNPQGGTFFHIYLPEVKAAIEETETISPAVEGGTETILVAEDDTQVRGLVMEILNSAGYAVIEAIDGEDAIKKFLEHSDTVELLLLDVVMPRKNGKETYDEISELNPDIKVIFMSGYTGDVIVGKGIVGKEYDFIHKPLFPNELLIRVRETLGRRYLKECNAL